MDANMQLQVDVFETAVRRHRWTVIALFSAFIGFYFLMVLGAAYFRHVFAMPLIGRVNVGLAFAIAQYFFAGLLAWGYVVRMRDTDRVMNSLCD